MCHVGHCIILYNNVSNQQSYSTELNSSGAGMTNDYLHCRYQYNTVKCTSELDILKLKVGFKKLTF